LGASVFVFLAFAAGILRIRGLCLACLISSKASAALVAADILALIAARVPFAADIRVTSGILGVRIGLVLPVVSGVAWTVIA
jgi:hypothetical protein